MASSSISEILSYLISITLVRGPFVLKVEQHDLVMEVVRVVHKGPLISVSRVHLDLIVSWVCIEETENMVVSCTIN